MKHGGRPPLALAVCNALQDAPVCDAVPCERQLGRCFADTCGRPPSCRPVGACISSFPAGHPSARLRETLATRAPSRTSTANSDVSSSNRRTSLRFAEAARVAHWSARPRQCFRTAKPQRHIRPDADRIVRHVRPFRTFATFQIAMQCRGVCTRAVGRGLGARRFIAPSCRWTAGWRSSPVTVCMLSSSTGHRSTRLGIRKRHQRGPAV